MPSVTLPFVNKTFHPFQALLILALVFGILDILDAALFWGLSMGVGPVDVLQGIASGLVGSEAYHGGMPAAVLGAVLQYCSFFCLLGVSQLLTGRFPVFAERPMAFGLAYGLASFVVVHYLLLPLTSFHIVAGFYPGVFANALLAQTVFIGLPSAILAGAKIMGESSDTQQPTEMGQVSHGH